VGLTGCPENQSQGISFEEGFLHSFRKWMMGFHVLPQADILCVQVTGMEVSQSPAWWCSVLGLWCALSELTHLDSWDGYSDDIPWPWSPSSNWSVQCRTDHTCKRCCTLPMSSILSSLISQRKLEIFLGRRQTDLMLCQQLHPTNVVKVILT
jgi:hypothetical protein